MIDIVYKTKSDVVYSEVRQKIINKEYNPGDRLVVADLARSLNVSPMPVREALIRLAEDDLVVIIPHVGASVINFDKKRMLEIQQIRCELEVLATRLLAPIITEEQCLMLDDLLADGEDTIDEEDDKQYYQWNERFHLTIAKMNPNRLLEEEIKICWERMNVISKGHPSSSPHWRKKSSFAEHQMWVNALKTKDPAVAEAICRKHCAAVTISNLSHFD